jgi:hypothetical protein
MVRPGLKRMRVLPAALLGLLFFAAAARAQLMLQGAVGAVPLPKRDAAPLQRPASGVRLPRADSLFGHDLSHGGSSGRMIFEHAGKDLMLSRLAMAGESISRPGESCEMDIAAGSAIVIKPGNYLRKRRARMRSFMRRPSSLRRRRASDGV